MNRRAVYIPLLSAVGLILAARAKYLPMPALVATLIIIMLISLIRSVIYIRKKDAANGQISGLPATSGIVVYAAAFGVLTALLFIVVHLRHIGLPLLNVSLVLYIIGAVIGIVALMRSGNGNKMPDGKQQNPVYGVIIYLATICTVTGGLLKINHYPVGKFLMFGGLSFIIIFFIFIIANKKDSRRYSK